MMILFQVLEMKLEQVGFLPWLSTFILTSWLLEIVRTLVNSFYKEVDVDIK